MRFVESIKLNESSEDIIAKQIRSRLNNPHYEIDVDLVDESEDGTLKTYEIYIGGKLSDGRLEGVMSSLFGSNYDMSKSSSYDHYIVAVTDL